VIEAGILHQQQVYCSRELLMFVRVMHLVQHQGDAFICMHYVHAYIVAHTHTHTHTHTHLLNVLDGLLIDVAPEILFHVKGVFYTNDMPVALLGLVPPLFLLRQHVALA